MPQSVTDLTTSLYDDLICHHDNLDVIMEASCACPPSMSKLLRQNVWRPMSRSFSKAGTFVAGAIITGIIGNRADDKFISNILPFMSRDIATININPWGLISTACLIVVAWKFYQWTLKDKIDELQLANQVLDSLKSLDDTFLRVLQQMGACDSPHNEEELKRSIDSYFAHISRIFDNQITDSYQLDDCYAVIYRPDDRINPKNLIYWHGFNEPASEKTTSFPLGEVRYEERRGIPGIVFKENSLDYVHIAHVTKNIKGDWDSDDETYKFYEDPKRTPPHRSIAATSIIDNKKNKLGVLCFCTNKTQAFASENSTSAIKQLLPVFAQRVSTAIQISERIASLTGVKYVKTPGVLIQKESYCAASEQELL